MSKRFIAPWTTGMVLLFLVSASCAAPRHDLIRDGALRFEVEKKDGFDIADVRVHSSGKHMSIEGLILYHHTEPVHLKLAGYVDIDIADANGNVLKTIHAPVRPAANPSRHQNRERKGFHTGRFRIVCDMAPREGVVIRLTPSHVEKLLSF